MQTLPDTSPLPQRDRRSDWVMIASGLINTSIAAWLACPHPPAAGTSLLGVLLTAAGYVAFSVGAGVGLSWAFWRIFKAEFLVGYGALAMRAGVVWLLVPVTVFLVREDSDWALPLTLLIGVATAGCLRMLLPALERSPYWERQHAAPGTFALLPAPSNDIWYALAAAVGIAGATVTFARDQLSATGLLLASAAFLIQWQRLTLRDRPPRPQEPRRDWMRLGTALVFAILLTVLSLQALRERRLLAGMIPGGGRSAGHPAQASVKTEEKAGGAGGGYKGIILWTVPEKKQAPIIAPRVPVQLNPREHRPVVIPFDGPYWYFQPPHNGPGRDAHVSRGDPAAVYIRSTNNWLPLLMEAHQSLASSVDLACCRELDLDIRNGDNHPGSVVMGIVLTDSSAPSKPSISLGGQTVSSTQQEHFLLKAAPIHEVLRYALPVTPRIRKFDQITVVFFPSAGRIEEGVKIAVQDFVLIPR